VQYSKGMVLKTEQGEHALRWGHLQRGGDKYEDYL